MADEELVDPKKYLEDRCKPKCVKRLFEYQACVKRIDEDESGHKHCTGQYFDYWHCIDKCAQQLFQRDAQTITPEALESVKAALASSENEHKAETKKKSIPRKAAGQSWEDPTLADWPENDFRLFCGDLGNEVNDDVLSKAFSRFPSFAMARVVRDKRTGKTRGFGFVSFTSPSDLAAALKEMNGKYVGNRPIKLRKSNWKERTDVDALERQKNYPQKKPKPLKKSVLHK